MPYKDPIKNAEYNREYQKRTKDKLNKRRRERYATDPKFRLRRVAEKYSLTIEQLSDMFKACDNKCQICGNEFDIRVDWFNNNRYSPSAAYVDHNRACCSKQTSCGKCVRGLLCRTCNLLLGYAKDDIQVLNNAIKYLK